MRLKNEHPNPKERRMMDKTAILKCRFCDAEVGEDEAFEWVHIKDDEWCCPYCMSMSLPEFPA